MGNGGGVNYKLVGASEAVLVTAFFEIISGRSKLEQKNFRTFLSTSKEWKGVHELRCRKPS